jgi:hypothetical protein
MMKTVEQAIKKERLNFSTQSYPTFGGRGKVFDELSPPKTVTDSPYYWWFMFLRLNEDYRQICNAGGVGKYSSLYKDFGDIYKINFKEWWTVKAHLFSEPKKGYRMMVATETKELAPFGSEEALNLVVPLNWSQRSLKKSFTQLVLKRLEKGKRGVSVVESNARYRLGGRWSIEALSSAYKIYTIKEQLKNKKKVPLADIGILAELPFAKKEGAVLNKKTPTTVDVRATLTVLVNRHYKRAVAFINASATNSFPK